MRLPILMTLALFCFLSQASYLAAPFELMLWYEIYKFEFRNVPFGERMMAPGSGDVLMDLRDFILHVLEREKVWKPDDPRYPDDKNGKWVKGTVLQWRPEPRLLPPGQIDNHPMTEAYGATLRAVRIPRDIDFTRLIKGPGGSEYKYTDWGTLSEDIGNRCQDTRARVAWMKPPPNIAIHEQRLVDASQLVKQARLADMEVHRIPTLRAIWGPKGVTINAGSGPAQFPRGGLLIPEIFDAQKTLNQNPLLSQGNPLRGEFTKSLATGSWEDTAGRGRGDGYPQGGHTPIYDKVNSVAQRIRKPISKDGECTPRAKGLWLFEVEDTPA